MKAKIVFCIIFAFAFSNARVINLSEEKFASYFAIETGNLALSTSPFDQNVASVDSYSQKYKVGTGGEFGFIYSSPYIGWRFSFEILKPTKLQSEALAGTVSQYQSESDMTAVAPKLGVEIHLNRKPNYRFYLYGFYGTSNLQMTETYTGVADNVVGDHAVEAKSSSAEMGGGLGFETAFVDTTTFTIEIGHRILKFTEVKYSKDVTTFGGAKATGDSITNLDGMKKSLNFSGYTISIGFRFWL